MLSAMVRREEIYHLAVTTGVVAVEQLSSRFEVTASVGALAHELRHFDPLSVTTPGISTLQELADSEGVEVDCLGGRLWNLSQSFVGPLAEASLERMSFDRVFLGAQAVATEDGICAADHAQTRFKELMARSGKNVYVLADSSKLGRRPFHACARLTLPWTLVTDEGADPEQVQMFRDSGVAVQLAECSSAAGHTAVH